MDSKDAKAMQSFEGVYEVLTRTYRTRERRGEGAVLDLCTAAAAMLFMLTPTLFGVRPLATALLCAVSGHTLATLLGCGLGCLLMGGGGGVYFTIQVVAVLLRVFFSWPGKRRRLPESPGLFEEAPQLKITVAAISGFLIAAYQLLLSGGATYVLPFVLGNVLFTPLCTLLFSGAFLSGMSVYRLLLANGLAPIHTTRQILWQQAGVLALLFSFSLALAPLSLFGISLGGVFCAAVALIAARRFGSLPAAAAGFISALPLGAAYAPAYGFAGFLCGLFARRGFVLPMLAAVAAGSAWCGYVGGLSGFLSHMPELGVTTLFLYPFATRITQEEKGKMPQTQSGGDKHPTLAAPSSGEQLSRALSSMAGLLYRYSKEEKEPEVGDYFALCDRVCAVRCRSCKNREECWEKGDRPALSAMQELAGRLYSGAEGERMKALEHLESFCSEVPAIKEEARRAAGHLRAKKQGGKREMAASDFEMIAKLVGESALRDAAEGREDPALSEELAGALGEIGISVGKVTVYGQRHRRILASGIRWDGQKLPADKLHGEMERICGCALSYPGFEMEGGFVSAGLQTVRRYRVKTALSAHPGEIGEPSGDRSCTFDNREDYFYALLCDGMGSGEEAAGTAGLCIGLLKEILSAGNNQDTSLRILNNLVRAGEKECSATVDLLEIDLLYGKASFVKSGAAASYVKRGKNLFRIHSDTAPVGILRSLDAERVHFSVRPGDVIVLLSDGVSQNLEDAPWLIEYLAKPWVETLEDSASHIAALARKNGSSDDITVLLVAVEPIGAAEEAEAETEKTA